MNEENLAQRAARLLPYMLLAVSAAALAARCTGQLGWAADSVDARLVTAFACRDAGLVSGEWVASRACAPLFLPLYALCVAATGSADGLACFLALAGVALSLVVALAVYEALRDGFGRFCACCMALACLFFGAAGDADTVSAARLAALFFLAALLCAWRLYRHVRAVPDDGAPDARRVLLPFGTGLFAGLAIVCNPHVLAVAGVVLLVVALLASARRARSLAVFALWGLAGCLVVGVLYLWFWVVWFAGVVDVMALVPQALAAWLSGLVQLQTLPAYLHQLVFDRAAFIGTWALVVALVVWRWSGRTVPVAPRLAVLALDAVLLVLACADGFSTGAGSGFPLLVFVEFALPCYFLFDDMRLVRHPEILLLWVPGILLSLACQFLDGGRDCALYAGFAVSCMGAFATVRDVCMVKDRAAGEEAGATAGTTAGAARFLATGSTAARVLRVFGHACIVLALCAGAASCLLAPAAGAGASSLADNEALSGLSGATFKSDTIPSIAQG